MDNNKQLVVESLIRTMHSKYDESSNKDGSEMNRPSTKYLKKTINRKIERNVHYDKCK